MELRKRITRWMLPLIVALTLGVPVWGSFVIPNGSVTSAKLASGAAATNIGAAGVTQAMRVALGQQVSSSSGVFTTSSASFVSVTNLTVTITTTGRPVFLAIQNDGTGSAFDVRIPSPGTAFIRIKKDGSEIARFVMAVTTSTTGVWFPQPFVHVDSGASAASHTYLVEMQSDGATTIAMDRAVLVAFEL